MTCLSRLLRLCAREHDRNGFSPRWFGLRRLYHTIKETTDGC